MFLILNKSGQMHIYLLGSLCYIVHVSISVYDSISLTGSGYLLINFLINYLYFASYWIFLDSDLSMYIIKYVLKYFVKYLGIYVKKWNTCKTVSVFHSVQPASHLSRPCCCNIWVPENILKDNWLSSKTKIKQTTIEFWVNHSIIES